MDRLGTDEEAVYRALQKLERDPDAIDEVKKRYRKYGDLMADILDEFSEEELEYALQLLNAGTPGSAQRIGATPSTDKEIRAAAERIRDAVEGCGTDEEAIYATLLPFQRHETLLLKLQNTYYKLYEEDLRDRLLDELEDDKDELKYARELFESPFEVLLREGAEMLSGKRDQPRIGFGLSRAAGGSWFDQRFWRLIEDKDGVRLVQRKGTPHAALDALFHHQERWGVDCAQFAQILEWYAFRHSLGAKDFDSQVGGTLVLRTRKSTGLETRILFSREEPGQPMKRSTDDEEDSRSIDEILEAAPIGSRIRWTSLLLIEHPPPVEQWEAISKGEAAPEQIAYQNENTIKLARDEFAAHPLGNVPRARIEEKLVSVTVKYVPGATEERARRKVFISEIEIFERPESAAGSPRKVVSSSSQPSTSAEEALPTPVPALQRKPNRGTGSTVIPVSAPPIVHEVLSANGQPLDADTRAFMERRFTHDFGDVRVHTNDLAAESARVVNAFAYTVGQHVVFAAHQYAPRTSVGQHLLAHELAHTIQQSAATPRLQRACAGLDQRFRQRTNSPDPLSNPCRWRNSKDCCDKLEGCDRRAAALNSLANARYRLGQAIDRLDRLAIGRELRRTFRQLFGKRRFKKEVLGRLRQAREWLQGATVPQSTATARKDVASRASKGEEESRRAANTPRRDKTSEPATDGNAAEIPLEEAPLEQPSPPGARPTLPPEALKSGGSLPQGSVTLEAKKKRACVGGDKSILCGLPCGDSVCEVGELATTQGGLIWLCPLAFEDKPEFLAATLIHEAIHDVIAGKERDIYSHTRLFRVLTKVQDPEGVADGIARQNPDSYAALVLAASGIGLETFITAQKGAPKLEFEGFAARPGQRSAVEVALGFASAGIHEGHHRLDTLITELGDPAKLSRLSKGSQTVLDLLRRNSLWTVAGTDEIAVDDVARLKAIRTRLETMQTAANSVRSIDRIDSFELASCVKGRVAITKRFFALGSQRSQTRELIRAFVDFASVSPNELRAYVAFVESAIDLAKGLYSLPFGPLEVNTGPDKESSETEAAEDGEAGGDRAHSLTEGARH